MTVTVRARRRFAARLLHLDDAMTALAARLLDRVIEANRSGIAAGVAGWMRIGIAFGLIRVTHRLIRLAQRIADV
ncbi:MAG TPA: hypothetical protein VJ770_09315 [Stellaceae bacterium]|nr:hypothetical protein [Stellaceae bacterium]